MTDRKEAMKAYYRRIGVPSCYPQEDIDIMRMKVATSIRPDKKVFDEELKELLEEYFVKGYLEAKSVRRGS